MGLYLFKRLFCWAYFRGSLFAKRLVIGRETAQNTKIYSLKQLRTANSNSPWTYHDSGGLIIGRIFASEIWGAYFREGFLFGVGRGVIIGILRELHFDRAGSQSRRRICLTLPARAASRIIKDFYDPGSRRYRNDFYHNVTSWSGLFIRIVRGGSRGPASQRMPL